jgi:hypothetical protein
MLKSIYFLILLPISNFFIDFLFDIPSYAFKLNDILLMFELLVFHGIVFFKDEIIKLLTSSKDHVVSVRLHNRQPSYYHEEKATKYKLNKNNENTFKKKLISTKQSCFNL